MMALPNLVSLLSSLECALVNLFFVCCPWLCLERSPAEPDSYPRRASQKSLGTATPAGKMVFTVLGAVAELERSLICERVRLGLRHARAKGVRLGQRAERFRIASEYGAK